MNDLHELGQTLSILLAQLAPQARGAFMRQVAKELRQRQQKHIQAQQNPDSSPFVARKKKRRDKQGRIKRKMFTKLRTARFIKAESNADEAAVTFSGKVNNLVRVHHYGLRDKVTKNGPMVKYERRQLLGFTDSDLEWIGDLALEHIAK
ncbi:Phage virion morphogenesis protein [Yersinia enterocolitica]|uniref:phage virion morphogenesis protein n=1 Tax=Yersinia enterocolitica TaxID=630 RepID=UPI0005E6E00D|nr:phage virion morphogenesis protein [Yersinia enterocolitica]AOF14788.1 phage virion morphogenesis protein [Yersinia enterocolitica]CFV26906.1 Phage virion morphogenesis protein [Yersinia enterocolitica]